MKSEDKEKNATHGDSVYVCMIQLVGAEEGVINPHKLEGSLERTA